MQLQLLFLVYRSILKRRPAVGTTFELPPVLLEAVEGLLPLRRIACRLLMRIAERFPASAPVAVKYMVDMIKTSLPNAFMTPGVEQDFEVEITLECFHSINSALASGVALPEE